MAAGLKSNKLLYLYGITESTPPAPPTQAGVDRNGPVYPINCEGVVCWVSDVSAVEFGEQLASNMESLDWLAEASIAHQRAIATIAQEAEVLPARFGTVFRSAGSLQKHVAGRLRHIKRDFKRVRDADEWGVKVFAIKPAASIPQVRSGKDYLKAKAALLPRRAPSTGENSGEIREFEEALDRVAEESSRIGTVSSGQRGLAFQTSLLVKRRKQQQLQSVLRKFSKRWAEERKIECTGPWPPYSFVSRASEKAAAK